MQVEFKSRGFMRCIKRIAAWHRSSRIEPIRSSRGVSGAAFTLFAATALAAALTPVAIAAEFGTRNEAIAMVHRVQDMFKKLGPQATFIGIRRKAPGTIDRDLYAYVVDQNGVVQANGAIAAMTPGTNLYDFRDQNGKYMMREQLEVCKGPGHGWVDFRFLSPLTKTVEDKSTYIERMGDYCVGVGIYRNEQINENTVGIISGSPSADDTYMQIAYDLASVLNDSDRLRILPIIGIGGPQNIRDVRYLKGVDIGLTQVTVLNSFRSSNQTLGNYDDKIVYIAKLFNEEVHLLARPEITSIDQLNGRKVNLDQVRSGTSYTMRDVFKGLGVKVEEVNLSQAEAIEKLNAGEIAATALVAGKPANFIAGRRFQQGIHLLPIPFVTESDFLPTDFTAADYPNLIPPGQSVATIADQVVLIGYNWPRDSERFQRVRRFVEAFFPKIDEFRNFPRHLKWREVNLAVKLSGWKRFGPAEEWLAANWPPRDVAPAAGRADPTTVSTGAATSAAVETPNVPAPPTHQDAAPINRDELFRQFLRWIQGPGGR